MFVNYLFSPSPAGAAEVKTTQYLAGVVGYPPTGSDQMAINSHSCMVRDFLEIPAMGVLSEKLRRLAIPPETARLKPPIAPHRLTTESANQSLTCENLIRAQPTGQTNKIVEIIEQVPPTTYTNSLKRTKLRSLDIIYAQARAYLSSSSFPSLPPHGLGRLAGISNWNAATSAIIK